MAISPKDTKRLWGLAAGRCSKPGCNVECIRFLSVDDPTVIGEMAHVIARSADGPRGTEAGGDDTYGNLILLCPTHHTEIDKAPDGVFTAEALHEWKRKHEERVRSVCADLQFSSVSEVCTEIDRILVESRAVWSEFGPESNTAKSNPIANLSEYWSLRKLDTIVPNNTKVTTLIEHHKSMFTGDEYAVCIRFCTHAAAFERNCYDRIEGVPRFPLEFEAVIKKHV